MVCAMTILAAMGDISRFPASKQLVGYAGLGARIHASGQVQRSGGITKEGRNELRTVMVSRCLGGRRTSSPLERTV
jgi:transposase